MTLADLSCSPESMEADRVAGAPSGDQWLQRRHLLWGASDVPVLFAARGWLSAAALTDAQRKELEDCKRGAGRGVPKYLARKAGLMRDKKGQPQHETEAIEKRLLSLWRERWAEDYGVDPDSVRHSSDVPREFLPLVCRVCHVLGATPDAWGRDIYDGSLTGIELKAPPDREAWAKWGERWTVQVHAQNGVCGYSRSLLVCGEEWAIPDRAGRVTTTEIERDEQAILRTREAAVDAWETVRRLVGGGT